MKSKLVYLSAPPAPAATSASEPDYVELRSMGAFASPGVTVDAAAGRINNVSAMTAGPAMGHGFEIDDTMLGQVAACINASGGLGVKMRLGHPPLIANGAGDFIRGDAVGQMVGTFSNARVEAGQVRGDVQLGDYAEHMPSGGNAKAYLAGVAKQHPHQIGLSVAYTPDSYVKRTDPSGNRLPSLGRVKSVDAVDFVDKPAANSAGLLGAEPSKKTNQTTSGVLPGPTPSPVPPTHGGPMDPALRLS